MKHVISTLKNELWTTMPTDEAKMARHEELGSIGKLGVMRLMSNSMKVSDYLREYIGTNIKPEDATPWLKELNKQEFTKNYIKKHQPFNLFYNQKTGRNEVEKQPDLLNQIGLFLLCDRAMKFSEEEERKQQAQQNEGQV